MKHRDWLFWVVALIAIGTVFAGSAQVVAPAFVLRMVGGSPLPEAAYVFAIVGMFMVLFGGMTLHALFSRTHHSLAILWASLQKLGAAGAVWYGVSHGFMGSLALAVGGFDLLSGILMMMYFRRIHIDINAEFA